MNKKLEIGMYIRAEKHGIKKILDIGSYCGINQYILDEEGTYTIDNSIIKSSHNIIDLIEYMDLLNIENPIKLYDEEIEVSLFNPVRCDGFAIYEDGTTCIILNLDYFVDVKTLKIKSIVTKEQFKSVEYEVK